MISELFYLSLFDTEPEKKRFLTASVYLMPFSGAKLRLLKNEPDSENNLVI